MPNKDNIIKQITQITQMVTIVDTNGKSRDSILTDPYGAVIVSPVGPGPAPNPTVFTHSSNTATTTSKLILAANPNRKIASISNEGTSTVYLHFGTGPAISREGIPVGAGFSYEIKGETLHPLAIHAITFSGTANIAIQEGV